MDVVDRMNEAAGFVSRTIAVDRFLQLTFIKSETRTFFDRESSSMRTFRVETRECPETGLRLQCRFPVFERPHGGRKEVS